MITPVAAPCCASSNELHFSLSCLRGCVTLWKRAWPACSSWARRLSSRHSNETRQRVWGPHSSAMVAIRALTLGASPSCRACVA